jgi:hypothetical protein
MKELSKSVFVPTKKQTEGQALQPLNAERFLKIEKYNLEVDPIKKQFYQVLHIQI